ncbi:rRNA-binding ribosome biosynthesis protein [Mycoemilia scoparia]|uniref:rRNA-binding ribosome biosynthesis protein n=1 Tax=Mycoemilia scoparia TaxID=417184 RepID=A0A9W7ZVY5_9FUNG|nr:rRNA-binding ribosome biosynthesis protein [Mycoemilia scoparia]
MAHKRKKKRTQKQAQEEAELASTEPKTPKSFVVKSGKVGRTVANLVRDFRQVLEPNTATKLKERKSNKIRDYVNVAGPLGVSHFMMFSQTDVGTNLRIARLPRGPTLTFRVQKYSLTKDCLALQKNPRRSGAEQKIAPLLLLNNFNPPKSSGVDASAGGVEAQQQHQKFKLMTAMLQNLFPAINPANMVLADARRVVLFNYNTETDSIDFRHYAITVKPIGVTKGVKKIITNQDKLPDLHKFDDVSEYVLREAFASESDVEDGPDSSVTLSQNYVGRGNRRSEQRAIKLVELGPRMDLKLIKIEAGLCEGDVLYHSYIHKTEREVKEAQERRQKILTEKARRRKEQEDNVARKKAEKEKAKKAAARSVQFNEPESEDENDGVSELEGEMEEGNLSDVSLDQDSDSGVDSESDDEDEVPSFGGGKMTDDYGSNNLFTEDSESGKNDSSSDGEEGGAVEESSSEDEDAAAIQKMKSKRARTSKKPFQAKKKQQQNNNNNKKRGRK